MSKYSGSQDFKDILDANFKNFQDFIEGTNGVIYQWDENGQLTMQFIGNPLDLVKYYSCRVDRVVNERTKYIIYLGKPTAIQKWFETHIIDGYKISEDDINKIIELAKDPSSGYNINDPRLIGAFLILNNRPPEQRYII